MARRASPTDDRELRELAMQLFGTLRRRLEASGAGFSGTRAAEVAFVQLCRPGRPGARLSPPIQGELQQELARAAAALHDVSDARQLLAFCRRAAEAALLRLPRGRHPGATVRERTQDLSALARAAVWAEVAGAKSNDDLVRRAVTRALRERGRHRERRARIDVNEGDPLREMLHLPERGAVYLPPGDLRVHLSRATSAEVLRKAASFSESALRPVLGEELWGLCRPVGFADRRERRLLVRVRSSAMAHEVSMRKAELLHRLRQAPGFGSVQELRFVLEEPRGRPVE